MAKKQAKRLFKSKDNQALAGVFGGIGDYFDIDPVLLRVAYVLVTAFTGFAPGLVAYIILVIVIPDKTN